MSVSRWLQVRKGSIVAHQSPAFAAIFYVLPNSLYIRCWKFSSDMAQEILGVRVS